MQKYYPVLSIALGILFLLLPIVILSRTSATDDDATESTAEAADEPSAAELDKLKKQITQLSATLPRLERELAELRGASAPDDPPPVAATSAVTTPTPASDRSPTRSRTPQRRTTVEIRANDPPPNASAPPDDQSQADQLDQRLAQLSEQLSDVLRSRESQGEESPVERRPPAVEDTAASEAVQVTSPMATTPTADAVPLAMADPGPTAASALETATTAESGEPDPEKAELLSAREMASEASRNLRDRVELDEPPVEDGLRDEDLVEIILQTPKDGMTVNRVEQLYAVTREPGWPVVLVRSSFDDEEWWAQPISGRRGTQIMSRVHFGNDRTPRGSAFTMVILLLDGYEEAVRFRTARRFTKLPKGIRRSQAFMFVLK